jgi:hypothetical protein
MLVQSFRDPSNEVVIIQIPAKYHLVENIRAKLKAMTDIDHALD